jgi:DHA1 family bicyclomycin/chloramphenicol resistance-like MFS transporter
MKYQKVVFLDRRSPPHMLTLVLLSGVGALSMSVFLPAMFEMSRYFNTSYTLMQLSISLYLIYTAFIQLIAGPISDRLGRRVVTIISVVIFVVASLGCYLSVSLESFLFFRLLQGTIAAGFLMSRTVIRDIASDEHESASLIGYVAMGMALIPLFAPVIGGVIDEFAGWPFIFIFIALLGFALLLIIYFDQGETKRFKDSHTAFSLKAHVELFKSGKFWGYSLTLAFSSGCFFAFLGGAPYVASEVHGLSSIVSGIFIGFPSIGYFVGNYLSGTYSREKGTSVMILLGCSSIFFGMLLSLAVGLLTAPNPYVFFGLCLFVGFGCGLIIPNASAGILSVNLNLSGTAGGIGNAIMIGLGAVLATISSSLLEGSNTSIPLQLVMLISSIMAFVSFYFLLSKTRSH